MIRNTPDPLQRCEGERVGRRSPGFTVQDLHGFLSTHATLAVKVRGGVGKSHSIGSSDAHPKTGLAN